MINIVGVRFREVGKIYYFNPNNLEFKVGDKIIVETSRGLEFGKVVLSNRSIEEEKIKGVLKDVVRVASLEDIEVFERNKEKEVTAFKLCKEKILEYNLDMKLILAEYTFDGTKLIFYFTSDQRVDFRELVKDLATIFKIRIELRQVGVRDETKLVGGIGSCGRPLCCHTYLSNFSPISIKAAKDQNLSLNPQKISGVCGRLMCCLQNEEEVYEELNQNLPNEGEFVKTKKGEKGVVVSLGVLRQKVKILIEKNDEEKEIKEFHISELEYRPRKKENKYEEVYEEDLEELEDLKEELEELEDEEVKKAKKNFKKKYYKNRKATHKE